MRISHLAAIRNTQTGQQWNRYGCEFYGGGLLESIAKKKKKKWWLEGCKRENLGGDKER